MSYDHQQIVEAKARAFDRLIERLEVMSIPMVQYERLIRDPREMHRHFESLGNNAMIGIETIRSAKEDVLVTEVRIATTDRSRANIGGMLVDLLGRELHDNI